jgi:hypothetical protein
MTLHRAQLGLNLGVIFENNELWLWEERTPNTFTLNSRAKCLHRLEIFRVSIEERRFGYNPPQNIIHGQASSDRFLLAGNVYVKNSSFMAMFFFPLVFSKALVNGMHMSPYIIPITFSGEIAGMCSRFSTVFLEKFISLL